jgi:hypothetical protein
VTYDLVDDSDRCQWHFLSSALPGDGGVGVVTGIHVACGSQFRGHLTDAQLTSCRIYAQKHLKPPSNKGFQRTNLLYPSVSPASFFFFGIIFFLP